MTSECFNGLWYWSKPWRWRQTGPVMKMWNQKWSLQLPDSWDYREDLCKTPWLEEGGSGTTLCHLHANSAITPTFFTKPSHFFASFTSLFNPVHPPFCPSPAVLLPSNSHLLPLLPFIPSLETSPLQGKTSAAHFVSLFVPAILPSLHFSSLVLLIRSLSPYNRLLEPLKIHISTSLLLAADIFSIKWKDLTTV